MVYLLIKLRQIHAVFATVNVHENVLIEIPSHLNVYYAASDSLVAGTSHMNSMKVIPQAFCHDGGKTHSYGCVGV